MAVLVESDYPEHVLPTGGVAQASDLASSLPVVRWPVTLAFDVVVFDLAPADDVVHDIGDAKFYPALVHAQR